VRFRGGLRAVRGVASGDDRPYEELVRWENGYRSFLLQLRGSRFACSFPPSSTGWQTPMLTPCPPRRATSWERQNGQPLATIFARVARILSTFAATASTAGAITATSGSAMAVVPSWAYSVGSPTESRTCPAGINRGRSAANECFIAGGPPFLDAIKPNRVGSRRHWPTNRLLRACHTPYSL
jgi:hypothetical protein